MTPSLPPKNGCRTLRSCSYRLTNRMETIKSIAIALCMPGLWVAWKLAGSRVVRSDGVEIRIIEAKSEGDQIDVSEIIDEELFQLATSALSHDFDMDHIGIKVYLSKSSDFKAERSDLLRTICLADPGNFYRSPHDMEGLKQWIAVEIVYAHLLFNGWLERNGVDFEGGPELSMRRSIARFQIIATHRTAGRAHAPAERAVASEDEESVAGVLARYETRRHSMPVFMRELKHCFTRWFNHRHSRQGALCEELWPAPAVVLTNSILLLSAQSASRARDLPLIGFRFR